MNSLLTQLYYGQLCPNEQFYPSSMEYQTQAALVSRQWDALLEEAGPGQKTRLENWRAEQIILQSILEEELFCYAFRLGCAIGGGGVL